MLNSTHVSRTQPGLCNHPCNPPGRGDDCRHGLAGIWLSVAALDACVSKCRGCARCRYVSFSEKEQECFWWHNCHMDRLHTPPFAAGFHSVSVASGADGSGGGDFNAVARRLLPRLNRSMLAAGTAARTNASGLQCFLHRAARFPVTVAALGGSITAGLSYKRLDPAVSAKEKNIYHRFFARWLHARFPRAQRDHLQPNRSINLGIAAAGPAIFGACLASLLPSPPDLALLEAHVHIRHAIFGEWRAPCPY
jgi:hypothetical protein